MKSMPATKYRPFPHIHLPDRTWPEKRITRAPRWCSVDLRDGNQALVEPMDPARKLRLFETLIEVGFQEIEVSFPASSTPDFELVRRIIEEKRIPDHVTIQVLTQARDEQMERTFEALRGAKRAVVHVYNSTSELQRRVVFQTDRKGCMEIATHAAKRVKELAKTLPDTDISFEYSPESYTGTELDFAVEICEAVCDVWQPTPQKPVILNLPATVEMSTPNLYADSIEWFLRSLSRRESVVLSVHPHNDRGTAVAAAELALLAGADRVEGTLFGNGERTGNVDIVTLALNMYTQGVDPELAFWDIDSVIRTAEACTRMTVHPRHPYAGELVFTAFSGSHQDAIRKGFLAMEKARSDHWEVPYLPIDPADLGRSYEPVIRINSQSGKGGAAFVVERARGLRLPRALQVDLGHRVQLHSESVGGEVTADAVWEIFRAAYLASPERLELISYALRPDRDRERVMAFEIRMDDATRTIEGSGSGPLEALVDALARECGVSVEITDYQQHAIGSGAGAEAAAYVQMRDANGGQHFGVAIARDSLAASLQALTRAVDKLWKTTQSHTD